jgi:hypothetical protein
MVDFRRVVTFVFMSAVALLSFSAQAQTTDDDMCRNGLFPREQKSLLIGKFAGAPQERLYFYGDTGGCPGKGADCRTKAYVLPGDELLLGKVHGDWTCAWYEGKAHETVGWVPNRNLVISQPQPDVSAPDWLGTWKVYNYPGYINIARKGNAYYVRGNTRWIGAELPNGSRVEHLGDLAGELKIDRNRARLGGQLESADGDCAAEFTRVGRFLVVHDNAQCGGANVRFDGVYTKAVRRP